MRRNYWALLGGYLLFIAVFAWWTAPPQAPIEPGAALYPIYNAQEGRLMHLPLEEYVACVVAAEMPAIYELEALKAQAVAARTRIFGAPCAAHPEAVACTSSLCCQAYLDEANQRGRWGEDYAFYAAKIAKAAAETADECLTYQGEPILVLYHAVSGGHTEDVELVYDQALPYLRGVESEGEEHASRYESEQRFTRTEFAQSVNAAYSNAKLTPARLESQVEVEARSDTGRVLGLRVGGARMDGRALRKILGLYSTNFTIQYDKDMVIIEQRGYGHGVGMSQAGAQAMALAGNGYQEILTHYYTGVQITHMDGLPGPQ